MSEIVLEEITLEKADLIVKNAISKAREIKINPIMVVLLDHRGAIKACSGEDGISSLRFQIAHGKANGAFQMGMGSRALFNRAEQQARGANVGVYRKVSYGGIQSAKSGTWRRRTRDYGNKY